MPYPMPTEAQMNPSIPAPLLYQLMSYMRGQPAPEWKASDYAMGLSAGEMPGLKGIMSGSEITRPWVGIKPAMAQEGTAPLTVPKSYTNPTEVMLPPNADELAELMRSLGGTMNRR